jgi:hypothetical protein
MSAESPTQEEMQDLVSVVLPRVIVNAMCNPEGEFYNGDIVDEARDRSLKEKEHLIQIEIPLSAAKELSKYIDTYAPLMKIAAQSCFDALYKNNILNGE